MILLLPFTLLSLSWTSFVYAGSVKYGEACSLEHQRLELGTYQFMTDCDSMTFCNSTGQCDWKGCRRDEFPLGYDNTTVPLPPKCDTGSFCPDEEDACQPVLAVGSPCQLNRDDECAGPSNYKELADTSGYGLNVNGSVCLNNVCMWANVTVGLPCVVENTGYIVYSGSSEYVDIVSRGNCHIGLYCDSQSLVCMQQKDIGETCDADKECSTYNCQSSGTCGRSANKPDHVPFWVYIIVGICIFGGMFATLISMCLIHRRHRNIEREKRMQYWREQNAFRQNIMQMQETARHSIMTMSHAGNNSPRSTMYSREGVTSEDSQMPMLNAQSKSSALRYQVSDDGFDGSEESIMIQRVDRKDPNSLVAVFTLVEAKDDYLSHFSAGAGNALDLEPLPNPGFCTLTYSHSASARCTTATGSMSSPTALMASPLEEEDISRARVFHEDTASNSPERLAGRRGKQKQRARDPFSDSTTLSSEGEEDDALESYPPMKDDAGEARRVEELVDFRT
ncbi:hypothetical protein NM688_g8768 [Phlebia brevispora]|uniref:Uncharacterized protein n=1 Tax=Phlebia brevispora TaxID=194682 RepID=A0ACC1RPY2_9APHY|nr:hypothetical protein NM688_g8768 [Phlebia brevispora]